MENEKQIASLVRYLALHLLGNAAPEMQSDAVVIENQRGLVFHATMLRALVLGTETAFAVIPPAPTVTLATGTPSHGGTSRNALNSDTCDAGSPACDGCGVCAGPTPTQPYN